MSEFQSDREQAARKLGPLKWVIAAAVIIGVAAVLYVIASASFKPAGVIDLKDFKKASLAKLDVPPAPRPAPDVAFTDASGKSVTLADFKGRVVVMNIWATWCGPCKTELPTFGKLQAAYATQPLDVVAITVDKDVDLNLVQAALAGAAPLKLYRDPGYKVSWALEPKSEGFPTTVIYDKRGLERARLTGPAEWASPEARGLVEALLAEH